MAHRATMLKDNGQGPTSDWLELTCSHIIPAI
jgi:hypothetical protein